MIKNAVAPIQAWLLSQGRCVGCGKDLSYMKKSKHKHGSKVVCNCGRIYIHNGKTYRRALISEVK
jgi:hypothetical protein